MTTTQPNKNTIQRPDWLPEEVWPFEIKTTYIEGHQITYTDEGRGPVLLLVHDGMWSFIWGQLIERLRKDYRVVTLDFPGSGLSPASHHPTSIKDDSALLEKFVDHLQLDRMTLVLHDLGGSVGVGLAARRPESIEGMAMTNTFAWRPHVASLKFMFALMTSRTMTGLNVGTNLVPKLTSTNFGVGRHLDEAGRRAFLGGFLTRSQRRRFHDLMESAKREVDYLESLEIALETTLSDKPVLTVYGEKNDPFGFQARFKDYFPHAAEMIIPKGNHFPMSDDPEGVARKISDWRSGF